jgi:putative endonuclease
MDMNIPNKRKLPAYSLNHNNTLKLRLMRWLVRISTPAKWAGLNEPEPPQNDVRAHALWLGRMGEAYACWWLRRKKGIYVIERNYRNSHQEIDIIGRDGNVTVFVEVRTLKSDFLQSPSASIKKEKADNIRKAAGAWRLKNSHRGLWRIDIVGIVWPDPSCPPAKVDHWEKSI